MHTKQLPNNLGAIFGAVNCLVVFHNLFSPFNPSLNFLEYHLNSGKVPPWRELHAGANRHQNLENQFCQRMEKEVFIYISFNKR